jgi:hypothetical protein
MPEVAMAVKMPWPPSGAKLWLVKFSPWNAVSRNAAMTSRMIAIFHHTSALFTRANHLTPK